MKEVIETNTRSVADLNLDAMAEEFRHQFIMLDISGSMKEKFRTGNQTKIQVARALLTEEAPRRAKLGSTFGLLFFNTMVALMHRVGAPMEEVTKSIASIQCDGGTNIRLAITEGLAEAKMYPSPVGWNQLVIVTDAEDYYGAGDLERDVEIAAELSVSVDVILIMAKRESEAFTDAVENLKELALRTQGRMAKVYDADTMSKAFREVAHRPLLFIEAAKQ